MLSDVRKCVLLSYFEKSDKNLLVGVFLLGHANAFFFVSASHKNSRKKKGTIMKSFMFEICSLKPLMGLFCAFNPFYKCYPGRFRTLPILKLLSLTRLNINSFNLIKAANKFTRSVL